MDDETKRRLLELAMKGDLVVITRQDDPRVIIEPANRESARDPTQLHCSFCGKGQSEVANLIAGPAVFICNECVDLCTQILRTEGSEPEVEK